MYREREIEREREREGEGEGEGEERGTERQNEEDFWICEVGPWIAFFSPTCRFSFDSARLATASRFHSSLAVCSAGPGVHIESVAAVLDSAESTPTEPGMPLSHCRLAMRHTRA
jgi:hypothetical protein